MKILRVSFFVAAAIGVGCSGQRPQTQVASTPTAASTPTSRERSAEPIEDTTNTGGIVIEGQLGHLSQAQLRSVLDPATTQLADCYNSRLAEHPYLAGHIELKIRIGADGVPLWVIPMRSTLGDRVTEQCMIERTMALRFPRPRGGETETVFPLDLEGGDDVRPAVVWPTSRIDRVVHQRRSALQDCVRGTTGPFEITLYAAPRGTVASVGVGIANHDAAGAIDCLVREVSSWRLPDPGSWYAKVSFRLE